ncbi:MAG: FG-GAP-like repeat-containing protein [Gemmataceae bacterium]
MRLETLEARLAPAVTPQPGSFTNLAPVVVAGATGTSISVVKQMVTTDLNGDGVLDLVIANDNSVSLRLGVGGGQFEGTTELPFVSGTSDLIRGIAVGDLNGDGAPDLAVARTYTISPTSYRQVDVLLNDGSGGFNTAAPVTIPLTNVPSDLVIAELTGDGRADLLINHGSTPSIWRQQANGTFTAHSTITGVSFTTYAVGDLDGDLDLDVAFLDRYASTNQVRFYANNGSGTFALTGSPVTVGSAPTNIALADLDGDGRTDFVTANSNSSSLTVGWNDGGSFSLLTVAVAAQTDRVGIADVDGDGDLDLAGVSSQNANSGMSVRLNEGFRSFTGSRQVDVGGTTASAAFGDFDGDGTADVAAAFNDPVGLYATNAVFIRLAGPVGDFPVPGEVRVGDQPTSLAYGDFNADGIPDLVVANYASDTVTIHYGDGSGGFNSITPITLSVGDGPTGVAVGDLDSDGQADDLVVTNRTAGSVTVRRGNGNGTFTNTTLTGFGSPEAVALFDVNNDGKLDFVAVGTQIVWRVNDGTGTFSGGGSVNPSTTLTSVAVGRVNPDSFPDLVVVNNSNQVRTYFHTGGATAFTTTSAGTTLGTGITARGVTLGDVDNDGDLDLVTANPIANQSVGSVSIRLNSGGTFSGSTNLPVGRQPYAVALADLDGDGKLDLAVANGRNTSGTSIGSTVGIRRGNGNGTFSGTEAVVVGDGPVALALRDVNGDGLADLAAANYDSDTVSIRLNRGGLRFTGREDVISEGSPSFVVATDPAGAPLDFNGDGFADLVVASQASATVSVYFGDESGRFTSWTTLAPFTTNYSPVAVVAADFDGDGFTDLAVASNVNNAGEVQIRHGDGAGGFTAGVTRPITGQLIRSLQGGDFDGDGNADLVVIHEVWSGGAGTAKFWFGDGMGDFPNLRDVTLPNAPVAAAVADLDHDGDLDVVVVHNINPSPVHFLINQDAQGGNRIVTSGGSLYTFSSNVGLLSVAVGDLTGDGVLDLVVGSKTNQTASVLRGASTGANNYSVASRVDVGVGRFPTALAVGDVNGDGHLDLVSAAGGLDNSNQFNNDTVSVRLGDGLGGFTGTAEIQVGNNPTRLVLADFTGDGLPEIITANTGFGSYPAYTVSVRGGVVPTVAVTSGSVGYSAIGQSLAVFASVTLDGSAVASGSVTFIVRQETTVIGTPITVPVNATGIATGLYPLPAGMVVGGYTIEADYTGRGANAGTGALTVTIGSSTTSLATNSPTTYGDDIVLTATVTATGGVDLTGRQVRFFRGSTELGVGVVALVGAAYQAGYTLVGGLPAGTYTNLHAELAGDALVSGSTSADVGHVVDPKALTVLAAAKTRVYGQANPPLTYSVTGLVGSDTLSGALATSATVASGVGQYAITRGTLAASANYTLSFTGATLTVDPKPLPVVAYTQTKVYGAALPALTYNVTGLVGTDTLTGALTTSATAASDVGPYDITQGTLAASANYTLEFTAGILNVTPAPLAVAADNLTKLFGEAVPPLTFHLVDSLVNDDTLAEVFFGALATAATAASLPGTYSITRGSLGVNANYALAFTPGTLTVTATSTTALATDSPTTYGDDIVLTATVTATGGVDLTGRQVRFYRGSTELGVGVVALVGAAYQAGFTLVGGLPAGTYTNLHAELAGDAAGLQQHVGRRRPRRRPKAAHRPRRRQDARLRPGQSAAHLQRHRAGRQRHPHRRAGDRRHRRQ